MVEQKTMDIQKPSGTLLGIVLDLSGSMQSSIDNKDRKYTSRIESLSRAFTSVIEDAQLLTRNRPLDQQIHLRLFVHGFGFQYEGTQPWQSSIGDVFSVITSLDENIAQYRPLHSELEALRILAKERFTRAVLITIAQKTKNKRTTLTLDEIAALVKYAEDVHLTARELPIFGGSPMGLALNQTFLRLQEEARLPQNQGLHPAIVIISDGIPTDGNFINSYLLAEDIKRHNIPIICCFVTNRNVGRPWILPRQTGWFWSEAAKLMFALSSEADEWPQLSTKLKDSRFSIKNQSKLFIQINHAEYLQNFIEALLLPIEKETKQVERDKNAPPLQQAL